MSLSIYIDNFGSRVFFVREGRTKRIPSGFRLTGFGGQCVLIQYICHNTLGRRKRCFSLLSSIRKNRANPRIFAGIAANYYSAQPLSCRQTNHPMTSNAITPRPMKRATGGDLRSTAWRGPSPKAFRGSTRPVSTDRRTNS